MYFQHVLCIAALSSAMLVSAVAAQNGAGGTAAISGQVTILERPGDVTEDLGNVVVYLEPAGNASGGGRVRQAGLASTNTAIALQSRQFSPRVRVITEGSSVVFRNEDPFNHNVFSKMNGGFDTGVYGRGRTRDQTFREAGIYPLYCNIHPRMTAFVIALRTAYFGQAGADGRFVLDHIPPGRYALHAWHDRAMEKVVDVTIPAAGATNVRVELDARGYKYVQHKNKFGQDYTSASGDRY
jgi:plastocyanin